MINLDKQALEATAEAMFGKNMREITLVERELSAHVLHFAAQVHSERKRRSRNWKPNAIRY